MMKAVVLPEKHGELTHGIIGAFFDVYNDLGYGFLERVYENAIAIDLRAKGLHVIQQHPIHVYFRPHVVGDYVADLVVEDKVIIQIHVYPCSSVSYSLL
jgi:GxxExxY protein